MSKTIALDLDKDRFTAIFGAPAAQREPGRSRLCRVCGDWHSLTKAWPHNCRTEAPPRSHLPAPRIAPKFEAFKPNLFSDEVISDPRSKRAYMERHDLVEYDEGVKPPPEPTDREWEAQFVADFKRAAETDPLNRPPVEVVGQSDLEQADEISVDDIEVAK